MNSFPLDLGETSLDEGARFHDIVGQSARLREVWQEIDLVAKTGCTVIVTGETGTGKELVARALHERSGRRSGAYVKVNCAAIPSTLLESELFGHEKGAFTGAVARRTGRFELAHGGTLFLDEIGEVGLDIQPKLLRMIQEREFERLGSSETHQADVRVVTATHRNLAEMCEDRAFREDLFYRLNVFPIRLPALRERRDDIPLLVRHFVRVFAQRMGKDLRRVSAASMESLLDYHWPGNIRELQNVIERAIILAAGPELEVHIETLGTPSRMEPRPSSTSLAEVNRAHIVSVLESTHGVVAGPHGAAARLGLKRSTLVFRMKRLGIPFGRSAALCNT